MDLPERVHSPHSKPVERGRRVMIAWGAVGVVAFGGLGGYAYSFFNQKRTPIRMPAAYTRLIWPDDREQAFLVPKNEASKASCGEITSDLGNIEQGEPTVYYQGSVAEYQKLFDDYANRFSGNRAPSLITLGASLVHQETAGSTDQFKAFICKGGNVPVDIVH